MSMTKLLVLVGLVIQKWYNTVISITENLYITVDVQYLVENIQIYNSNRKVYIVSLNDLTK